MQEGLQREQPVAGARASAWRTFVRIAWGATFAYGAMLLWQGFCITGLGPWSTRGIEFFVLVPFNYPCILHPRVCRTDYGLCRLEAGVNPGAPCACRAYNGMWLQGICIR